MSIIAAVFAFSFFSADYDSGSYYFLVEKEPGRPRFSDCRHCFLLMTFLYQKFISLFVVRAGKQLVQPL